MAGVAAIAAASGVTPQPGGRHGFLRRQDHHACRAIPRPATATTSTCGCSRRHYGRHIPGNPNFDGDQPARRRRTAAGSTTPAWSAPQDGTFLTIGSQALLIFEATGQRGLQVSLGAVQVARQLPPVEQRDGHLAHVEGQDARRRDEARGDGRRDRQRRRLDIGPVIYNAVLGTKFKMVSGYPGGAEIDHRHAARRGRRPRQQHLGGLQGDVPGPRSRRASSTC